MAVALLGNEEVPARLHVPGESEAPSSRAPLQGQISASPRLPLTGGSATQHPPGKPRPGRPEGQAPAALGEGRSHGTRTPSFQYGGSRGHNAVTEMSPVPGASLLVSVRPFELPHLPQAKPNLVHQRLRDKTCPRACRPVGIT